MKSPSPARPRLQGDRQPDGAARRPRRVVRQLPRRAAGLRLRLPRRSRSPRSARSPSGAPTACSTPSRSHGLPPFLTADAGVNSGLMIAQYTQAAMVAENRRLAAPASVDSLPTSAMQEDHVSMGWGAARKLRAALANLRAHPRGRADLRRARARPARAAAARRRARAPRWRRCARASTGRARTAGWRPSWPRPRSWSARGALLGRGRGRDRGAGDERRRDVRAPRGTELSCAGWPQEAALRMLMNNLDPDVAERPDDLVVYGGTGRAARSWEAFDAIVRTLRTLDDDETLLVQSGKPVGVFRTHEWAPRVLIANSNLVPEWATWDEFRRLEDLGLTMYGQMTAGSWIYIGTQGIVQGTYECFAEIARRRYGGSLAGTITLTAGLGGMGGAQPLAVTMNGGVALCVEVDRERIERRARDALPRRGGRRPRRRGRALPRARRRERRALSVGLCGQRRRRAARAARAGLRGRHRHRPDERARPARRLRPQPDDARGGRRAARPPIPRSTCAARAPRSPRTARRWSASSTRGAEVFDYGNSLRAEARLGGFERAFAYPGFVPAYIRPLFCEGKGPFRWVGALGRPGRHRRDRPRRARGVPRRRAARRAGSSTAGERIAFQGLPARICWLGYGERAPARAALQRDGAQRRAEGADRHRPRPPRLGLGRLALPRDRGDGRRVRRDRRLAAAERARQHRRGRVLGERSTTAAASGIGRSIHAGMVCVADGTELAAPEARARADRRPGHGRHAPRRRRLRRARSRSPQERGVRIPMREDR